MAAQFIGCVIIWTVAFLLSPTGDQVFGLMFYFYWPALYVVDSVLGIKGESGMFATAVLGLGIGVVAYGLIFGLILSYFRGRNWVP